MLDDNNYEKYGDYGGNYQNWWGVDEFRHNGFHILGYGALRHSGFFFLLMVLSNRDVTKESTLYGLLCTKVYQMCQESQEKAFAC